MTESEWRTCAEPAKMLEFVRQKVSERKLRLFLSACCRRVWQRLPNERSLRAVEVGERFADNEATAAELAEAERDHNDAVHCGTPSLEQAAPWLVHLAIDANLDQAFRWIFHDDDDIAFLRADEAPGQAALLHDVVGDPFHPAVVERSWLAWDSGLVVRLAQVAYEQRQLPAGLLDNSRLAILADALEEAGCSDAAILGHCRGGGTHVRGCWIIDLLLDKS